MSKQRTSAERVDRILQRARRETSTRDLLVFGAGRAWSIVLIVAAAFFVIADRWAKTAARAADTTGKLKNTDDE